MKGPYIVSYNGVFGVEYVKTYVKSNLGYTWTACRENAKEFSTIESAEAFLFRHIIHYIKGGFFTSTDSFLKYKIESKIPNRRVTVRRGAISDRRKFPQPNVYRFDRRSSLGRRTCPERRFDKS